MNITVARHVFGSIRGYTTLAKSGDLSPEETAKLEMLSFGQTNESSYLGSLQTNPAYISRPLHSRRWAVTRVFQGKPDDHNRTTLLFISAVITIDDWLYSLKCDVNKLLYYPSLWQWNGEEKLDSIEITVEGKRETTAPEIRNKVLTLLAAVEKYTHDENTTIVVRTSDFDAKVLRWVNMILPVASKQTFSCAARSLNDGLPFTLISMAKEGSFGNSRRRTVNWTLTSTVDNCSYAESLTQFWQPGGEPPWKFIDSCKSFLIDLGGKPEPEPRERLVVRKPLYAEVAKPRIGRKTYFSRKLAVILFICAVVACITIGAMYFKANKEHRSLIEANIKEAENFLVRNSPRGYFPVDRATREQAIEECGPLKGNLEASLEQTKDPLVKARLRTTINELKEWLNSAQDAHQRYNILDKLLPQFKALEGRTKQNVYPDPSIISNVDDIEQSMANIDKVNLVKNYISKLQNDLRKEIYRWQNAIGELLKRKKDEVRKTIQSSELEIKPANYTERQYREYERQKLELKELEEDESLNNAEESPIEKHREIAKGATDQLDVALAACNSILKKLDGFKKEAETFFNKANDILNDPNITNGKVKNFDQLVEARALLDKARELWPDKPDLEKKEGELSDKFTNNRQNILKRWEEEIERIEKETVPDDPNTAKINELYEKAKAKLQNTNIENIGDSLEKMKAFDDKLREELSSISKPKQKKNKKGK